MFISPKETRPAAKMLLSAFRISMYLISAMFVFLSDGFVTLKESSPTETKRFFEIAEKLPFDIQELLAKNMTSSSAIPSDYISLSIKSIFLSFIEDSVAAIGDAVIGADLE